MGTHEIRRRVISAISQHAGAMSPGQLDRALSVWDRAVKQDLTKSGDLTIDTTEQDCRREEREREEANLGNQREERGRAYKVRYGDGRTLAYQIGSDGALIITPDKPGDYTPKDYKAMLEAITRGIQRRERTMEKSKSTGSRWSRAPMLLKKPTTPPTTKRWEQPQPKAKAQAPRVETKMQVQPKQQQAAVTRQPWGTTQRLWGTTPTTEAATTTQQVQPQPVSAAPQAPLDSRGHYDLSRLNGFQIAGMKAGLDPMTPGLEGMSFDQMQAQALEQAKTAVAGIAERSGLAYVRDNRPRRF